MYSWLLGSLVPNSSWLVSIWWGPWIVRWIYWCSVEVWSIIYSCSNWISPVLKLEWFERIYNPQPPCTPHSAIVISPGTVWCGQKVSRLQYYIQLPILGWLGLKFQPRPSDKIHGLPVQIRIRSPRQWNSDSDRFCITWIVWLRWTILRASPRYSVVPPQIHSLIKPSQIAVYPQIHIYGLQDARGDQSIISNDSTSSIFYPASLLGTLDVKTGLTEFYASGRLSFRTYLA